VVWRRHGRIAANEFAGMIRRRHGVMIEECDVHVVWRRHGRIAANEFAGMIRPFTKS